MFFFLLKSCGHLNNILYDREEKQSEHIQPDTSGNVADHATSSGGPSHPAQPLHKHWSESQLHQSSPSALLTLQALNLPCGWQSTICISNGCVISVNMNIPCSFCQTYTSCSFQLVLQLQNPNCWAVMVFLLCHSSITVPIWQINLKKKQKQIIDWTVLREELVEVIRPCLSMKKKKINKNKNKK